VFESLFECSSDAIWLFELRDPRTLVLVDCNRVAVELVGARDKQQVLHARPEDLSPPIQPDGSRTSDKTAEIIALVHKEGTHRFEWLMRRLDGREVPMEVSSTAVTMNGKTIHVVMSRDISERKNAERALVELNQSLERRVAERTASLSTSEARFRALVEHAPEAIVVFDGNSGRFLFGNQHACNLYGVPMQKLAELTPADVSPQFQPSGGLSGELAREKMEEALAGGTPVFEWIHKQPNGRLIPTEVRLLPLPAEGQNLIRASIIDNTERKRAENALRESEAKFRALFEGSSQGVVLHDQNKLLEVNPAAVRIMRRRSADELVGKDPRFMAPTFQPNGERSEVLGAKYIDECMAKGSARFEWMASGPNAEEIPLEVALTRIQWSGRQVIQAFVTDITGRKQAEHALLAANRELQREIEQRTRAEESLKERVRMSTLTAEVAVALNAGNELQPMLQSCAELVTRHLDAAFVRIWTLNQATQTLELQASAGCYTHLDGPHSRVKVGEYKIGWIALEKKPLLTNSIQTDPRVSDRDWAAREGMVAFAGYPLLIEDRILGVLAMFARRPLACNVLDTLRSIADSLALGIERKRAQTALAESEARFSAAFQASPILTTISQVSGRFVLVNDAFVNWSGYTRDEILERNSVELSLWQRQQDREAFLEELQRTGSIRERECCLRSRTGKLFTMLLSSKIIQLNHVPHLLTMGLDISGRKEADAELRASEARLRESEARFSVAFQASPIFIAVTRMDDGRFVLANDAFVNWAGYHRDEIIGSNTTELSVWERSQDREAFWEQARRTGSVRQLECRFRNREGKGFAMLLSAERIQLNNVPHLLTLALDITERQKAEAELRASEARLRESEARFSVAFQASPVFISILRVSDEKYVLANDALLAWLGCPREDVLGRTSADLGMWDDPAEREQVWRDLRGIGSIRQRECRWRNRRGDVFTILLSVETITLGNEPHVLSLALDISQRKQTELELRASEARLRESEARFNVAFQASPVFINILRLSDRMYVWANDAFVNRLGYSREEVLGRTSAEFGMWESTAERDRAWEDMLQAGSIRQRECRWLNRQGEPFTILLSAEIIKFNDAPHILSLALDITKRKRAEEELLKSLEREKELGQLKSNFVSMVSHEFRTPLGIIQSSAELLRDFLEKMRPAEREEQVESIIRNTRRMAGMMEEILVLSRLDAGKLGFQPVALDLSSFCHRVMDEVLSATNRCCPIELSVGPLPAAQGDERLLGHIFTNLLSNAVKYSQPGTPVRFNVERHGTDAICLVQDEGIGISESDQANLFTAFHRGSNVGPRPGTGLGLLVVKRCVDLHRGAVTLRSRLGQGTAVTVRLPLFSQS
jgi:PAS domain S-box-containing protein